MPKQAPPAGFRLSRIALLLQAGASSLSLFAPPVHAQSNTALNYDFRGADGTCCSGGSDPDNGHDGQWGQRDFIQHDSNQQIQASNPGQAGILIDVSGGAGGNGQDAPADRSHWGGNGGGGRNIDYTLSGSTVTSSARGIDLYSTGGHGGMWANASGPNGGYGIGGDGNLARITLTDTTVSGLGFGIAVQSWGGGGSDSAIAGGFGGERDAGHGGNAGEATVNLQGNSSVTARGPGSADVSAAVGLISSAGSGGTGQHSGDFGGHSNAGNGGSASAISFSSSAGSAVVSQGDGVYGVVARSLGGSAAQDNPADIRAGTGGGAGAVTIANGGSITTSGNRAIGIYALSQGGNGGNGGDGSWSYGHDGGAGGYAGSVSISNTGAINTGSAGTVGAKGIVASVLGFLLAPYFSRLLRFYPPVLTGTVITLIGVSLLPVAFRWAQGGNAAAHDYGSMKNIGMAALTLVIALAQRRLLRGFLQQIAILLGLVVGTLVAVPFHMTSLDAIRGADAVGFPTPFHFGAPHFEAAAIVSMCIVMLVCMTESTADMLALGKIVGRPADERTIEGGLRADTLG
ncbi:solute carrier family 23 protein, partial [Bordetella petrii]|uniref:solute carrier family 23 protein n=1 Tax=Bordetella petrii TaxID=94624 RepID=UPI002E7645F8